MLDCYSHMPLPVKRIVLCGGGAKSALWKTILANILNIELQEVASEQGPGLGGAILAMVGADEYTSVNEAAEKIVEIAEIVEPEKELTALYEDRYNKYRQIYPALKNVFGNLR